MSKPPAQTVTVYVCDGAICRPRGADALRDALARFVMRERLQERVHLDRETCFGHCVRGPNVMLCRAEDGVRGWGPPAQGTPGTRMLHESCATEAERELRHELGLPVPRAAQPCGHGAAERAEGADGGEGGASCE